MCVLRVDINFAVNYPARFMNSPGPEHWYCLLHLLAYLRQCPIARITYTTQLHNPSLWDNNLLRLLINVIALSKLTMLQLI